ncbi:MAG: DMT family transporter [Betaproteobacteria bacterium]|nr:DMT family transporter [Betaproteobacteria bacterium]
MSLLQRHPALKGIILMVAAIGVFSLMDTCAKYLAQFYPVPAITWARYVINFAMISVYLAAKGRFGIWRTQRPLIQLTRGLLLVSATLLYFTSLSVMPIAEAAGIGFVMPLFVAALAIPILKERLDMPRLIAILIGFAGAMIIVRPGSGVFSWYALLPVAMAFCNALYQVLTRMVAGVDSAWTSLFWGALVGTVLLSLIAPFVWVMPHSLWHWALLLAMGFLATIGHLSLIRAFDYAGPTTLAPFVYTALIWVMLLGWIVFGDFPDAWSLAGMAIIVASGLYIVNRQRLTARREN